MADRTVRAIFEARVSGARKGMTDLSKDVAATGKKVDGLTKDLKTLDGTTVKPEIDVKIDAAKKRLGDLTRELAELKALPSSMKVDFQIEQAKAAIKDVRSEIKELTGQKSEVRIDAAIGDAQKRIKEITSQLGDLRTMEVTPQVTADIKKAEKDLAETRKSLRQLNGAKAEMKVTADTSPARQEVGKLADDIGDAGGEAGDEAGMGIASGIVNALRTIPVAGAVIGVGVAIAGGILIGIKQGLQIEAERDIFSAQTGLDEDTSARFGRAAGEAYANAWGDSVAANLDTAKRALQAGIINQDATDAEIENVVAKLQGLNDLFEYDIAMSVQGVGNLMKTGLVKDADVAFDLIVAASQKLPSDDLIETLNEYSNQFVQMGLTGQQAFGLIVQGAEAGARDTDIVADAIKEMGLRIREDTKASATALAALGLRGDRMAEAFNKGGPAAVKAIDTVFDRLRKLEAKGGNTQAVIAGLFGGPGEDLGSALFALDVDKAAAALDGMEGSAGAADRALATMSDNTAAKMESAKRNVELAMDGIKGALAEAFGDEISDAADWVSKNRAPMIEFFQLVMNGAFEMGKAFAGFGETALLAIADVMDAAAKVLVFLPGFSITDKRKLEGEADAVRESANSMKDSVVAALGDAQSEANAWLAPEIMKARLHDATAAMTADVELFEKQIEASGGTVEIDGETVNAEQTLQWLIDEIDATDGTVVINGDKIPAEEAFNEILKLVDEGEARITIGGDPSPAKDALGNALDEVAAAEENITINGDTTKAQARLAAARLKVRQAQDSIIVNADTTDAIRKINAAARDRYMTINVAYAAGGSVYNSQVPKGPDGQHSGGFIARGLHAGGRVPGRDPGYDNVLWPLYTGGRTLQQPLAGGEFVVNSKDAAFYGPLLELMNSGFRPTSTSETVDQHIGQIIVHADTFDEIERKAREKQRRAALGRPRA